MVSITQLEQLLPENACFHDSIITDISIDYEKKVAVIHLDLCAGNPDSPNPADHEKYIKGKLTIYGLFYFIIEPPSYEYLQKYQEYETTGGLWVDIGSGNNPSSQIKLPQPLPEGAFYNWVYVNNWNSFIHIAAMDSSIEINE